MTDATASSARPAAVLGFWLAVFGAIGFSFKAILVKLAYPYGVDAVTLLALRMIFSVPCFVAVAWREGRRRAAEPLSGPDRARVAAIGVLGYYVASFLDFLGLQYISAGLERLILFLNPTLVALLSVLILGRRIGRRDLWALAVSYAGIALAFAHDIGGNGRDADIWLGGVLVFGSAVAYALYLIANGELSSRLGSARFTAHAMTWASAACIAQFLVTHSPSALRLPWQVHALAAAMALFSTVLPVFMVSAAIRRIGSHRAALVGAVGPVATIGLGWWLLGEPVSLQQLAGAALVMAGVMLVGRAGAR